MDRTKDLLHKANLSQYFPMTNYEVCYVVWTMSICVKYLSRMTSQEMEIWCQEVSEEILVNFMIDINKNRSIYPIILRLNIMLPCIGTWRFVLYMINLGMKQVLLQTRFHCNCNFVSFRLGMCHMSFVKEALKNYVPDPQLFFFKTYRDLVPEVSHI